MRLLELELGKAGCKELAYYDPSWRRDWAPLLDELGASIDHIYAHAKGGLNDEENLCTACWKCNVRKNSKTILEWEKRHKYKPVKGKYGEPRHWDGFSSVFAVLAERHANALTPGQRGWLKALKSTTPVSTVTSGAFEAN